MQENSRQARGSNQERERRRSGSSCQPGRFIGGKDGREDPGCDSRLGLWEPRRVADKKGMERSRRKREREREKERDVRRRRREEEEEETETVRRSAE